MRGLQVSRFVLAAGAAATVLAAASAAFAQEPEFQPKTAGTWMVNLRVTDVAPTGSYPVKASGLPTGIDAEVSDSFMPTIGISYFVTDSVAVEAIAGTTRHTVSAVAGGTRTDIYSTWVVPPTLTLQYHPLPAARFSPYVGAGVNYMLFYSGSDENGFTTRLHDGFGWVAQAGADIATNGPWSANLDVKKVFFRTDAEINGGALATRVKLDPWVVSVGLGRKF
jgi:outer membrane protein